LNFLTFALLQTLAFAGSNQSGTDKGAYYESYARYKTEMQRSAEQNPKASVAELRAQHQALWQETERLRKQQDKEVAKTTMNAVLKGALLNEVPKPIETIDKAAVRANIENLAKNKRGQKGALTTIIKKPSTTVPQTTSNRGKESAVSTASYNPSSAASRAPSAAPGTPAKPGGAKKINFGAGKSATGNVNFGEGRGENTNFGEGRGENTDFKKPTDAGMDFYTDKDGE